MSVYLWWLALSLLGRPAAAAEVVVVRADETLTDVAQRVGIDSADALRAANELAPGADPPTGTVLRLPDARDAHAHDAAVISLYGSGTRSQPGGGVAPLALKEPLPPGTQICTEAGSYATLRLAVSQRSSGHDDISLLPETCVTVEVTAASLRGRSSLVRLGRGSVTVQPNDADSEGGLVAVETADGLTAGTRGGFRVHKEPDASRTEAITSPLSVFGGGVEQPLEPGQGSRVRAGEAPSAPSALALAGLSVTPLEGARLRRPEFIWEPTDRVRAYRVEIAITADFRETVFVTQVPAALWSPSVLLLPGRAGGYWWRTLPVDRFGFHGMPSAARQIVLPAGAAP